MRGLAALLVCLSLTALAGEVSITAEQWKTVQRGDQVVALHELAQVVGEWARQPDGLIVIRHASGDEGISWAEEMRTWLVSLGIPSAKIEIEQGLQRPDRLFVESRPTAKEIR